MTAGDRWFAAPGRPRPRPRGRTPFDTAAEGVSVGWLELISAGNGLVHLVGHNVFKATGEVVIASEKLRFRTPPELTDSLVKAGFTLEHMYGDWDRGPLSSTSRAMVFIARRT